MQGLNNPIPAASADLLANHVSSSCNREQGSTLGSVVDNAQSIQHGIGKNIGDTKTPKTLLESIGNAEEPNQLGGNKSLDRRQNSRAFQNWEGVDEKDCCSYATTVPSYPLVPTALTGTSGSITKTVQDTIDQIMESQRRRNDELIQNIREIHEDDAINYRRSDPAITLFVLPRKLIPVTIEQLHQSATGGHLG
ncbi:hypothetical protein FF38_10085 [Lucilia cuprina]|uniref:Uncharacterized protein n=1 Tax=Lucilia cuprina TaxID=7375 RepID=A0A0L0CHD1_LUCCU|nr:hypothetical protein FF38_10085 [Lucilia cuprina]